jgi:predicted Zn-dependent protease
MIEGRLIGCRAWPMLLCLVGLCVAAAPIRLYAQSAGAGEVVDGLYIDLLEDLEDQEAVMPPARRPLEQILTTLTLDPVAAPQQVIGVEEETQERLRAAQVYADDGRWLEALREYRALMALHPDNAGYQESAALTAALAGQYGSAEALFREVVQRQPDNINYLNAWAAVLLKMNRAEPASQVLRQAQRLQEDHLMTATYRVIAAVLADRPVPNADGWRFRSLNELAQVARELSDPTEGWAAVLGQARFADVVRVTVGGVAAHQLPLQARVLQAAAAALAAEEWARADRLLDDAIARTADRPMLVLEQARARLRAGDAAAGVALAERVEVAYPDHPQVAYGMGYLLMYAGRYAEAVSRFERTVAADPERGLYRFALACALANAGQVDVAWPYLQQLAQTEPQQLDVWVRGEVEYLQVIQMDPRYPALMRMR